VRKDRKADSESETKVTTGENDHEKMVTRQDDAKACFVRGGVLMAMPSLFLRWNSFPEVWEQLNVRRNFGMLVRPSNSEEGTVSNLADVALSNFAVGRPQEEIDS